MAKKFESHFDARLWVAQDNAKREAQRNIQFYVPMGAIEGNFWEDAPAPGMYYDTDVNKWCPESFKVEKAEILEEDAKRILDTTPDEKREGYSINGKKLVPYVSVVAERMEARNKSAQSSGAIVEQKHQNTGVPATPKEPEVKERKMNPQTKVKRPLSALNIEPTQSKVETIPEPQPEVVPTKEEPTIEPQPEAVEQSKKTRRSAKMDEADFDTLAAAFIFPTELAEKKPLFFPEKTRESLRKVAGLIPGGKVSPSHVAIHIVNAWLDEHRDLLNRMFANQKTSI